MRVASPNPENIMRALLKPSLAVFEKLTESELQTLMDNDNPVLIDCVFDAEKLSGISNKNLLTKQVQDDVGSGKPKSEMGENRGGATGKQENRGGAIGKQEIRGGATEDVRKDGSIEVENRGGAADDDTDIEEEIITDMEDEPEPYNGAEDVCYNYKLIKYYVEKYKSLENGITCRAMR